MGAVAKTKCTGRVAVIATRARGAAGAASSLLPQVKEAKTANDFPTQFASRGFCHYSFNHGFQHRCIRIRLHGSGYLHVYVHANVHVPLNSVSAFSSPHRP